MIFKLHESKRWSSLILQIDKNYFSIFVEQILDILGPDVGRQVADVDSGLRAWHAH